MSTATISGVAVATGNHGYLEAEMARLRILLGRRVLWLRQQWSRDPLAGNQAAVISDEQADWLLAGEDAQAELEFYDTDPRSQSLASSLGAVEQRIGAVIEESTPPLYSLAGLFRLSHFERDVLLLAVALEIDPAFERLYAYAQDEVARRYLTPSLAATLLCPGEAGTALRSFLPGAVLRRYRLISLDDEGGACGLTSQRVRLDERIVQYLLGNDRLDARVAAVLLPQATEAQAADRAEFADRIAKLLLGAGAQSRWKSLHLTGPPDAGQRSLAESVCARLGLSLCAVDPAKAGAIPGLAQLMEREAILSGLVYYFDLDKTQAENRELLARELARMGIFYVTATHDRKPAEGALSVAVSALDAQAQAALWQEGLGGSISSDVVARVVEQFHFGPERIGRSIETARQLAALREADGSAAVREEDLWQGCRMQSGRELEELAQRVVPCHDWDDLVLPEDTFRQLEEVAAQVANRAFVYERWGFGRKLNRGRGVAALFAGPSGTGKTLAAEILAHHLRLDLFRIDLSAVVSKYIGETEKNLRSVFDAAERSGAVLFFDEADALFARRHEVKDSHDRYANLEVNYLLQRMEDYHGLAILATNRKDVIDEAFLRRLRFIVDFPFPDSKQRSRIWRGVFPSEAPLDGIDFATLARLEIPGGSIRNIAFNAAFQAAAGESTITMLHVMRAARREYHKIGKLMREAEFGPYYGQVLE